MSQNSKEYSKLISYWLRHSPAEAGLTPDELGWVDMNQLLRAVSEKGWDASLADLQKLNHEFDKVRWEIDKERQGIRATHGHSFPILLVSEESIPPESLFHGTAQRFLPGIIAEGLQPKTRTYVHLSESIDEALKVGARHGAAMIIEIPARSLVTNGWKFYRSAEGIWLTSKIPVSELAFGSWKASDNPNFALQLKTEIGARPNHPLFANLDMTRPLLSNRGADDVLFYDSKARKYVEVHLTWRGGQENEGWPSYKVFSTFESWTKLQLWPSEKMYYEL